MPSWPPPPPANGHHVVVDDTPVKIWNGFGELPNFFMTDTYSRFKLSWEAKGFKVIKK